MFKFRKKEKEELKAAKKLEQSQISNITVSTSISFDSYKPSPSDDAISLIDLDGYKSPSGGYVNYSLFSVKGTNPSTGRVNTRKIESTTEHDAIEAARSSGLIDPFIVDILPFPAPLDSYIHSVEKDFNITLPDGVIEADISTIVSKIYNNDYVIPPKGLASFATDFGVKFSCFVGFETLCRCMSNTLDDEMRAAFFGYIIHQNERNMEIGDMRNSTEYENYLKFGSSVVKDPAVMKTINRTLYNIKSIPHGNCKAIHVLKHTFNNL